MHSLKCIVAILVASIFGMGVAAAQSFHPDPLIVETPTGDRSFQIEVADSETLRARGLMFRRRLADDAGMLFVYPAPREITMWMRNTYISLDMLFIDEAGEIVSIHRRAVPHSLDVIASGGNAQYVLEITGGLARKFGFKVGQIVRHPEISPTK